MLRLLFVVILRVPATACAGWAKHEPDRPNGYAGLTLVVFEVSVDGGWQLPIEKYIWVRGRLAAGFEPGASSDEEWTAGLAGLEVRTRHRLFRVSAGLEAGGMRTSHSNEDGSQVE